MAKYSNTVEYNIKTTLDSSGIAKLQSQLAQLTTQLKTTSKQSFLKDGASESIKDIEKVSAALQKAFNPKLGMFSSGTFFKELKASGRSLGQIYNSFANAGTAGQNAFRNMYGQIMQIDTGMKSISKTSDKIMNTIGNTFRWGMIASVFSQIMNAAHQSVQYVQELDKSLTNIMMVSGETRDNMNEYARTANKVAQQLSATTVAMTNATQVFVQQGYDLPKSQKLAEYSTILGNISQQDTAPASDEITAYMNAYKIPLEDIGNALSKWAEVANVSAADVEELSVASQKAASVATTVGVDMDQLAATIATIETVTREAPENIGNGLKTIYSRLSDIKMGETLEDGVNLGQITSQLAKVGVNVLDETGKMRDIGNVMEDLMGVWKNLDQTSRAAVATTIAGRFQLARFESLMNRSDLYESYLESSRAQTGTSTLDFMQETYTNSLEGKQQKLQASIEEIFLNVFETSDFYGIVDTLTNFVDLIGDLTQALGDGGAAITAIVIALTKLAQKSISQGIGNFVSNRQQERLARENIETVQAQARTQLLGNGLKTTDERTNALARNMAYVGQHANIMNVEQQEKYNTTVEKAIEAENQLTIATQKRTDASQLLRAALKGSGESEVLNEQELLNVVIAMEKAGASTDLMSQHMVQFSTLLSRIPNRIGNFIENLKKVESTGKGFNELVTSAGRMITLFEQLRASGAYTEEQMAQLTNIIIKLEAVQSGSIKTSEAFEQELRSIGLSIQSLSEYANIFTGKATDMAKEMQQAAFAERDAKAAADAYKASLQGMGEGLNVQSISNQIINVANAAMTGVFAFQSLKSIIDILNNEDLTLAEAAEQLTMNFTMLIAMGIPAIIQFKTSIESLKKSMQAWQQVRTMEIALQRQENEGNFLNISLRGKKVQAIWKELAAQGQLNRENLIARLVEEGYTEAAAKGIATKILKINTSKTEIALITLETTLRKALTKVLEEETAARVAAFLTSGPGIAAILGLATAIGFLVVGINQLSQAEERQKQLLQEQIDASNASVQAIKDNKTELDKLYNVYLNTRKSSDELREALLKQAEALGIVDGEVKISLGLYSQLKNEIDEATKSQLNYNIALLQAQNKKNIVSGGEGLADSDVQKYNEQAGVKGESVVRSDDQGAAALYYSSTESDYSRLLKYQEEVTLLQKEISELSQQKDIAEKKNDTDTIKSLQADIDDKQNAIDWYVAQLESENAKKELANGNQSVEDERLLALANKQENGLSSASTLEDIESLIMSEQLGSAIKDFYSSQGENAKLAYLEGMGRDVGLDQETILEERSEKVWNQHLGELGLNTGTLIQDQIEGIDVTEYFKEAIANLDLQPSELIKLDSIIDWDAAPGEIIDQLNDIIKRINQGESLDQIDGSVFNAFKDLQAMGDLKLDADVPKEEFEELAEFISESAEELDGFDKDLATNAKNLKNVTESLIRYDKALERVSNNYEEWQKLLETGTIQDNAHAVKELKNTYNDLFDIGEGLSVSANFAKDVDNLNLLQDVLNNVDGAYEELQYAAMKDIVTNIAVNDEEAISKLDNLWSYISDPAFQELAIDAAINDEGFLDALDEMINAAGFTAEQAQAFLSGMGVDATVNEVNEEETAPQTVTNWIPELTWEEDTAILPSGDATETTPSKVRIPRITYRPDSQTIDNSFAMSAFGLETTSGGQSSGGRIAIDRSTARKGASGGQKFVAAPHGAGGGGKGGGGGGGKGGGGGGGKSYEPKSVEKTEFEKDPYQRVNDLLEDTEAKRNAAQKSQESLRGNKRVDALKKEADYVKQRISLLKNEKSLSEDKDQKIRIMLQRNKELLKQLKSQFQVQTDENGLISNRQEILDRLQQTINDLEDTYNNTATEEGQEKLSKQIDAAKEKLELFKKLDEEYSENILKNLPEMYEEIKDLTQWLEHDLPLAIMEAYEPIERTIELWHDEERAIKEVERALEHLSSIQDYVTGKDKIRLIAKQRVLEEDKLAQLREAKNAAIVNKNDVRNRMQTWSDQVTPELADYFKKENLPDFMNMTLEETGTWFDKAIEKANKKGDQNRVEMLQAFGGYWEDWKKKEEEAEDQIIDFDDKIWNSLENIAQGASELNERMREFTPPDTWIDWTEKIGENLDKLGQTFSDLEADAEAAFNTDKPALYVEMLKNLDEQIALDRQGQEQAALTQQNYQTELDKLFEDGINVAKPRINVETGEFEVDNNGNPIIDIENLLDNEELNKLITENILGKEGAALDAGIENVKYWSLSNLTDDEREALEQRLDLIKDNTEKLKNAQEEEEKFKQSEIEDLRQQQEISAKRTQLWYDTYKNETEIIDKMRELNKNIDTAFGDRTGKIGLDYSVQKYNDSQQRLANANLMFNKADENLKKAQRGEGDLSAAEAQKQWEAAVQELQDATNGIVNSLKELYSSLDDIMSKFNKNAQERLSEYEKINKQLSYTLQLTQLIYGSKSYKEQAEIVQLQRQASEQRIADLLVIQREQEKTVENLRAQYAINQNDEELRQRLIAAEEALSQTTEQRTQEQIKQVQLAKQYKDLQNEAAVQNWLNQFTVAIDGIEVPFEQAQKHWERIKEQQKLWLDDIERGTEVQKLQNKYLELANDIIDPKLQKQVTDQMAQQLEYLREKNELSEYDIKYANAQLEILQKQIALEEAQNAKTQMKLRRDSQGNYSYVYTADRSKTLEAETALLEAQEKAYEMSKEEAIRKQDEYFNQLSKMAQQMREVMNDTSLTEEQIGVLINDIIDHGYDHLAASSEQLETAEKNGLESFIKTAQLLNEENANAAHETLAWLEEETGLSAQQMIEQLESNTGIMAQKWNEYWTRVSGFTNSGVADWSEKNEATKEIAKQTADEIMFNTKEWTEAFSTGVGGMEAPLDSLNEWVQQSTNKLSELKGTADEFTASMAEMGSTVAEALSAIAGAKADFEGLNSGMQEAKENLGYAQAEALVWEEKAREAQEEIDALKAKVDASKSELDTQKADYSQLEKEYDDAKKQWEDWEKQYEDLKKENEDLKNKQSSSTGTGTGTNTGSGKDTNAGTPSGGSKKQSGSGAESTKQIKAGERITYDGWYSEDSWGNGNWGNWYSGEKHAVVVSDFSGSPYGISGQEADPVGDRLIHIEDLNGGWLGWIDPSQAHFKTGGYTGSWGEEGRLAVLHQKELVLNAQDTINILAAVDAVRQITEQLKGAGLNNISSISKSGLKTNNANDTIEQTVEITANFPNASSTQEIEQAFRDLTTQSFQFAHKNKVNRSSKW